MTFAKVLGIKTAEVSAKAKAVIGPIIESKGVTPIAVEKSQIPHGKDLKCTKDKHSPGNCGYLDFNTNGASGLSEAIKNGKTVAVSSQYQTEPGQNWGPVKGSV